MAERSKINYNTMKTLLFALTFLSMTSGHSQSFYLGYEFDSFKNLIKNGLTYIPSGNEEFDESVKTSLILNWKATEFKVAEKDDEIEVDQCYLMYSTVDLTKSALDKSNNHNFLAIVGGNKMKGKHFALNETIAHFSFSEFAWKLDKKEESNYCDIILKSMNYGVKTINEKQIKGRGSKLYKSLKKVFLEKSATVKNKRLIVCNRSITPDLDEKLLKKNGLNYVIADKDKFRALLDEKNENDFFVFFCMAPYGGFGSNTFVNGKTGEIIDLHYLNYYSSKHVKDLSKFFN